MGTLSATEMIVDVSKYLYFASHSGSGTQEVCPDDLVNTEMVQSYLEQLEGDNIESSGQLTKLSRIELVSNYALTHYKWPSTNPTLALAQQQAVATYKTWKRTLTKERTTKQKRSRPALSEELPSTDYMRILSMREPREFIENCLSHPKPFELEAPLFNKCTAYLAMHLYLSCVQRKSAV